MNNGVKVFLYVILVIVTGISGYFFFQNFGRLFDDDKAKTAAAAGADAGTSGPATATTTDTNAPTDTNVVATATTNVTDGATTSNAVEAATTDASTNAPADTNVAAIAGANAGGAKAKSDGKSVKKASGKTAAGSAPRSRIGLWSGAFFLSVIALGGFIAWDIASFMGNRAVKVIVDDDRGSLKDKEYEEAEKVWANGKPLDSIRMMREYLQKNPREVHVALRIAEIYEKDLNNYLAAALEYEDVLTKKLPDERWGWAAIHLCNLYFKLGNEQKAYVLLQRIVKEYGETQAAEKARKRLKEVDPNLLAEVEAGTPEGKAAPETAAAAEEPKSNLPPGFRPKK